MGIKLVAEIGINHNGSLEIAKKLIDIASVAGFDYVKFQKRNPDKCVPEDQKDKSKFVPWLGNITYLDYKKAIEFGRKEYQEIDKYCKEKRIGWFASVWDLDSAEFMIPFSDIVKIPSAHLTSTNLLIFCKKEFRIRILSTGMSTEKQIEEAVDLLYPQVIMHTNSVYPTPILDLNLGYIRWLNKKYGPRPNEHDHNFSCNIGYSSHYYGIKDAFVAMALGVTWIEKHVTLSHEMWGSDQKSSVEPHGMFELVKGVRDMEKALSKGHEPRKLLPGEEGKLESLRGINVS